MRLLLLTVLAGSAVLGLAAVAGAHDAAAPAPAAAAADAPLSKCFFARNVRNQTVANDHTVLFNVSNRDTYRITTRGDCLAAVSSTAQPAVEARGTGGQICNRLDVEVNLRGGGRCIVESLTQLTDAEVAALPGRSNPQMLTPHFTPRGPGLPVSGSPASGLFSH